MRSRVALLPSLLCLTCVVGTALGAIRITECPSDATDPTYSWDNDGEKLSIEGEGSCVTPSVIFKNLEDAPLVPMTAEGEEVAEETGIWLLTKSLIMRTGTTLLLHGDLDCEELRLVSSSSSFIELTAAGAYISLLGTKVVSWSRSGATVDLGSSDGSEPRSYIRCLSERIHSSDVCDGAANEDVGEGRLDIINSEVGYLGYQAAEAYGITYKVHGYCEDESNPEVFDRVNVRGDIRFSNIHHNWFGMYSYGHQDGLWEYNMMHNCGYYGFDPHDDSDNLRIHNNIVYKNGNHGIIASKRCNDVSIQNNVVYDNKAHGIMLHRSSDDGIIRNNTVSNNGEVCIALFESFGIEVSDNFCNGNTEGIRLSMGASYNKIFDNVLLNTSSRALWLYKGGDEVIASEATEGLCTGNLFENNYIDGSEYGVYFSETRDIGVIGNTFTGSAENQWQDSDGVLWKRQPVPVHPPWNSYLLSNRNDGEESPFTSLPRYMLWSEPPRLRVPPAGHSIHNRSHLSRQCFSQRGWLAQSCAYQRRYILDERSAHAFAHSGRSYRRNHRRQQRCTLSGVHRGPEVYEVSFLRSMLCK